MRAEDRINRVLEKPSLLSDYQLLAIPGGFSYGDDIAAGRIFANQIAHHLHDAVHDFIAIEMPYRVAAPRKPPRPARSNSRIRN